MRFIWDGISEAFYLLTTADSMVFSAAWRSLWISCLAVVAASALGLPIGAGLACATFWGRRFLVIVFRAGMALPTVFVGVFCYILFSRRGPLGPAELLYTPWAIVVGEFLLAFPIVVSITHGAVKALDPRVAETTMTLGAGPARRWLTYFSEARIGVLLAVLTAFARCVTELGIAMMVGGNIKGRTRTLAAAAALETEKGEYARGMAMGLLLLLVALGVMAIIATLSGEGEE